MSDVWTIRRMLLWVTDYFKSNSIESSRLDAELLISHAVNSTRMELYTSFDRPLDQAEKDKIKESIKRRISGEPVAYIIQKKSFWKSDFFVSSDVLIPRPDTETLVERVVEYINTIKNETLSLSILDVGTGSGCIPISIAQSFPELEMHFEAWDISEKALKVAADNAKTLGVDNSIVFNRMDVLDENIWQEYKEKFDIVISNPPYISKDEIPSLPKSVKDYEPQLALIADNEGYKFYEVLAKYAFDSLRNKGKIFLEVGVNQSEKVHSILNDNKWNEINITEDLAKIPRVIEASMGI